MTEESLLDNEILVGTVQEAEQFEECRKEEMLKLWIDLGEEQVQSAAQLAAHHEPDELEGSQVLCATDLGTVNIAGFESQVLTLGVPAEDGYPVAIRPDRDVPNGGRLH
ncbi:MAG: tRNA-binding protein, partial [Candidatus Nanohaloarchaea archaeon]|nr:tRNA-binding protein [Candidatus Nanohaloarchaea archaeon]